MATDNMPLTGNNLPGLVFRHGRTYGLNHAAELMAHMHPYRNGLLGPFIPIPNMKVRAANGCFMNFDQDVIRADFRHRNIHQFQTGASLRFYKSFHAPHSCSFSPASASSKFISERRKSLGNGGFRPPLPFPWKRPEQRRATNAGKTFLFNRQFRHTRNLPFPTGRNHDTKACEFSF